MGITDVGDVVKQFQRVDEAPASFQATVQVRISAASCFPLLQAGMDDLGHLGPPFQLGSHRQRVLDVRSRIESDLRRDDVGDGTRLLHRLDPDGTVIAWGRLVQEECPDDRMI